MPLRLAVDLEIQKHRHFDKRLIAKRSGMNTFDIKAIGSGVN
jgi:hypothetical protein